MKKRVVFLILCLVLLSCKGSSKNKVYSLGDKIRINDVELIIEKYELRYPILSNAFGEGFGTNPELAMFVSITNKGKKDFIYDPKHGSLVLKNTNYIMVFPDGDLDNPLKVYSSIGINKPQGQVNKPIPLKSGSSIADIYSYSIPPSKTEYLLIKIPGHLFGGKDFIDARIQFVFQKPSLPPSHEVNEIVDLGLIKLQVVGCKFEKVSYKQGNKKFTSANPLLIIEVKIINPSDKSIPYNPGHTSDLVNKNRPTLHYSNFKSIDRFDIKPNSKVDGLVFGSILIKPGSVIVDHFIFNKPENDTKEVFLHIPSALFGGQGIERFKIVLPETSSTEEKPIIPENEDTLPSPHSQDESLQQ